MATLGVRLESIFVGAGPPEHVRTLWRSSGPCHAGEAVSAIVKHGDRPWGDRNDGPRLAIECRPRHENLWRRLKNRLDGPVAFLYRRYRLPRDECTAVLT